MNKSTNDNKKPKAPSSKMPKKRIDHYVYHEDDVIGKGEFGNVFLGTDLQTNSTVAIKVIPIEILQNKCFESLLINEITALKKLRSPYIVHYEDLKVSYHRIYLITEYCDGGDLGSLLQKKGKLEENEVLDVTWQICEGFKEMKKHNMLHRDLKPQNILIHQGRVRLGDLGFSKTVQDYYLSLNSSIVGSPIYMSPQVLFKQKYTSKCDVWSLGILIYQLLFGKVPWHSLSILDLARRVKNEPILFPASVPISAELKDLIISCLRYEEIDRMSWDEVFEHPALFKSQLAITSKLNSINKQLEVKDADIRPSTTTTSYNSNDSDNKQQPAIPVVSLSVNFAAKRPKTSKPFLSIKTADGEAVFARNTANPAYVTADEVIPDPKNAGAPPQPNPQAKLAQLIPPGGLCMPTDYMPDQMALAGSPMVRQSMPFAIPSSRLQFGGMMKSPSCRTVMMGGPAKMGNTSMNDFGMNYTPRMDNFRSPSHKPTPPPMYPANLTKLWQP